VGERQQIRWLLLAGIAFFIVYVVGFALGEEDVWWIDLMFILGILGMPLAIANAIFRYRLWDLEVVVNRALIYGLLTTLLAGLFAAVIAVVTELSGDFVGDGSRALGAATSALVVAVVFQPLRAWIEGWVNRRFYPAKADLASGMVEVQPVYWGFLDRGALMRIDLWRSLRSLRAKIRRRISRKRRRPTRRLIRRIIRRQIRLRRRMRRRPARRCRSRRKIRRSSLSARK
jgi:hypothetical protein